MQTRLFSVMQICMLAPSPRHMRFMPCYLVRRWSCAVEIIACDVLCSGVKTFAVLAFIYTCGFVRMGVYLSRTMMFLQWYARFSRMLAACCSLPTREWLGTANRCYDLLEGKSLPRICVSITTNESLQTVNVQFLFM